MAKCRTCTNTIIYLRNWDMDNEYKLIKMNRYHIHTKEDTADTRELKNRLRSENLAIERNMATRTKVLQVMAEGKDPRRIDIQEYIRSLPNHMHKVTKVKLVREMYNITLDGFDEALRKINKAYDITFEELVEKMDT